MTPPVALTIAGSDSSGGAGIQADLKTFAALGVYGTSAITAITAQNTTEVHSTHPLPAEVVRAQVNAVLDDLPVAAVKTGMLATAAVVEVVADLAAAERLPHLVVDPVMVSSTGARLLEEDAVHLYLQRLLPVAGVCTPNLSEAGVLLSAPLSTLADQRGAARELASCTSGTVVVTGGRDGDDAVDVVAHGITIAELRGPWTRTRNDHGTGCTFASATAAGLAAGLDVSESLARAKRFVSSALAAAARWNLGHGRGPLDHYHRELTR